MTRAQFYTFAVWCVVCGRDWQAFSVAQRYCSGRCRQRARRANLTEKAVEQAANCAQCGRSLDGGRGDRRYCGAACKQAAYRARQAAGEGR